MRHPNEQIGPYLLLHRLGQGGFGEVWLAERRSSLLTLQVALKLPFPSTQSAETIRNEARIWLRASGHPNVVPVLDAEEHDGQIVIASEYVSGGSLAVWLRDNGGSAPAHGAAVEITEGILTGLAHLHAAGIVHRDLKPENVLLQSGIPRLTDFGISRILGGANLTENLSGSPRYMAPETFRGAYSAASDLWPAGVLLYEMLTGYTPFQSPNIMGLISAIQQAAPPPLPDSVPERLRAFVVRLLEKRPEHRYTSALQALEALRAAATTAAPTANDTSPVPKMPPEAKRKCDPAPAPLHSPVIPPVFSPMAGRETEMAELKLCLAEPETRLITLLGSGGNGKTRLAIEAARQQVQPFNGAVWYLPLADLTETQTIFDSLYNILALVPTPASDPRLQIIEKLSAQPCLLVIDNFEHLLPGGADLVRMLIEQAPTLKCLVTSQSSLRLTMERTLQINPLPVPDLMAGASQSQNAAAIEENPCVHLFIDRAKRARSDFTLSKGNMPAVVEICRRLDGIPLAIELAASWTKALTPVQMLTQLSKILISRDRDRTARHRSLDAVIGASWERLSDELRQFLTRLSVFRGGWATEEAEEICEMPFALLSLTELQDASLILCEESGESMRYRMLEPLREYAETRFAGMDDTGRTVERHRTYFLNLADEAALGLRGPDEAKWLTRLTQSLPNLRSAVNASQKEHRLRAAASLQRFWIARGQLREGRKWLEESLPAIDRLAEPSRGAVLLAAGILACAAGEMDLAVTHLNGSLAVCRALGDELGAAKALTNLANIASTEGDCATAQNDYEAALAIARKLNEPRLIATILGNLGALVEDAASARQYLLEALALHDRYQHDRQKADILHNLADRNVKEHDFRGAAGCLVQSIEIRRRFDDRSRVPQALLVLADLGANLARYDAAIRLLGAAEQAYEELGVSPNSQERDQFAQCLAISRIHTAPSSFDAEWTAGRGMRMEKATEFALVVAEEWK
jgi:predicted ATPase